MRPKDLLDQYSKRYPGAWKEVDKYRAVNNEKHYWPQWCYLPTECVLAIIGEKESTDDVNIMGALCAWRVSQGVYRFDMDVYKDVLFTPITGNIPHECC
ncbi:hypothetical protein ACOBQJ_03415 [Pelotomaculum propionicicum]|uniref:hypothetical protein n=1 Tax=Pelotomaculum propionicicum TaxID=258475 RepID=UPI003B7D58F6